MRKKGKGEIALRDPAEEFDWHDERLRGRQTDRQTDIEEQTGDR